MPVMSFGCATRKNAHAISTSAKSHTIMNLKLFKFIIRVYEDGDFPFVMPVESHDKQDRQ